MHKAPPLPESSYLALLCTKIEEINLINYVSKKVIQEQFEALFYKKELFFIITELTSETVSIPKPLFTLLLFCIKIS